MSHVTEVQKCEDALRVAMLAGDVSALSSLIDNRLVFTGPDGTILTKGQDLSAHKSGVLRLTRLDLVDPRLHPLGDMMLVTTKADLAGTFDGMSIDGAFAYTRLWSNDSGEWRVIAGHAARLG